jgi:hypothetical protein
MAAFFFVEGRRFPNWHLLSAKARSHSSSPRRGFRSAKNQSRGRGAIPFGFRPSATSSGPSGSGPEPVERQRTGSSLVPKLHLGTRLLPKLSFHDTSRHAEPSSCSRIAGGAFHHRCYSSIRPITGGFCLDAGIALRFVAITAKPSFPDTCVPKCNLGTREFLGRCGELLMNAAPLALHRYPNRHRWI